MQNKIYIGAHLRSRPQTTAVEFSSNLSSIYTKWCTKTFLLIFGLITIFDCTFANIVAPSGDENRQPLVHLKGQSILKKTLKTESKSAHKLYHNTCSNYIPLEQTAHRTRSVTDRKTYKHHIITPTAGAHSSISPKLCTMIEDVETLKKVAIIFRSNA